MQVHIRHEYPGATREQLERVYLLDEEFNRELFARLGFGRKVLVHEQRGDVLLRTLWLCPQQRLPQPFASLVPAGAFHIEEHVEYDFATHRGIWRTTPSVLSQHIAAAGTLSIEQQPRGPAFEMRGQISSTLPLLGKRAERQALSTAQQQHAALAAAVRDRLRLSGVDVRAPVA